MILKSDSKSSSSHIYHCANQVHVRHGGAGGERGENRKAEEGHGAVSGTHRCQRSPGEASNGLPGRLRMSKSRRWANSGGNRRNERVHRPESPGSLRRERDDGEQEAGAPRHPPLCCWLAWGGGSPSHLGSYVAPCQGHPFFVQPPSPVMGTLPLPAPLTPPPPPTWTGMAASPLRAGVSFPSSNPQAAWSWKRASLSQSACLSV